MTRKTLLDDVTVKIATENLKRLGNYGIRSVKLKAVIAAKDHGIGLTAEVFNINRKTLTSWVKEVNSNSIDNLLVQPGRGRKPKFNKEHKAKVTSWLSNDPTITIDKLLKMISSKLKLEVSRATVHRVMKELLFAYITPRPVHYKQDKAQQSEFKKKDISNRKRKS